MSQLIKKVGSQNLLHQILEEPQLITIVQNLEASVLGKLIQHIGLEDSGEIIALATTEQLVQIFDEDLWKNEKPGQEEKFDAERFGLWLQILSEAGMETILQKLLEMDEDFLTLAISCQIWVVDTQEIENYFLGRKSRSFGPEDLLEKALESTLSQEFENFLIISKTHETWDVLLSCFMALDRDHHDFLVRLLERCCYVSSEQIEDQGGLYQVLTAEEQLASDVAGSRQERQEKEGFVSPQMAQNFLTLARQSPEQKDWISPSYFKNHKGSVQKSRQTHDQKMAQFLRLLREGEVLTPSQERVLLENSAPNHSYSKIRAALSLLRTKSPDLFSKRMEEFGFLSNSLVSGCSFKGRRFRSAEAVEAVLAACELGLELGFKLGDTSDLVQLFRIGWNSLYQSISLNCSAFIQSRVSQLSFPWGRQVAESLKTAIQKGMPWLAADELDILEVVFDSKQVQMMKDLIGECPTFNGRFFSSRELIREAQDHLKKILK